MGMNESTLKLFTDPINSFIGICAHSDCRTKCCECFEMEIDTTHAVNAPQIIASEAALHDLSREQSNNSNNTNNSITSSSITKIIERVEET